MSEGWTKLKRARLKLQKYREARRVLYLRLRHATAIETTRTHAINKYTSSQCVSSLETPFKYDRP
jgi:hypothetical protein